VEIAREPTLTPVGTKIFYAKDPDGFWLEFTEMPAPAENSPVGKK
jgi:hypothetical protein